MTELEGAKLEGECAVTSWNEDTYAERDGNRKLTEAKVTQEFTGDITGTGDVTWLMSYQDDGTARFVGLQEVKGEVDGRAGSVVFHTVGSFDGGVAQGSWDVVEGSGTGELGAMTGTGTFVAPMGGTPTYSLDCTF